MKQKRGDYCNLTNWLRIVRARSTRLSHRFWRENLSKTILSCDTLETYEETPIFIPVDITEEAVESVAQKLSGNSGPGGTDSETLHVWILKCGEDSTRLLTSVENFAYWLANRSPT